MIKKLYHLLAISIVAFSSQIGFAQIVVSQPQPNVTVRSVAVYSMLDFINLPREVQSEIKGTPYLGDLYGKGNVYTKRGNFFDIEMRYNIFYDRIEFKEGDSVYAIGPDTTINKIIIGEVQFIVDHYELKGKIRPAYFMRLDSGKVTLLAKMVVSFRERQEGKPMQPEGVPARYDRMPDVYYFKVGSRPPEKIGGIKKLIGALPDKQQEMEKYVDEKRISARKVEELLLFVRHYNSLRADPKFEDKGSSKNLDN